MENQRRLERSTHHHPQHTPPSFSSTRTTSDLTEAAGNQSSVRPEAAGSEQLADREVTFP